MSNKVEFLTSFLFTFGLFLLLLWPLLTGKTVFVGDNFSLMVPGKLYSAETIQAGQMPFWNHYTFSGSPFIADINQSFFYPTTFLFVDLPPSIALNISILIHFLISGVGMYYLVKRLGGNQLGRLVAVVAWLYSQQFYAQIHNLAAIQTVSWIPWLIYLTITSITNKRHALLLPIIWLIAIVAGHPQPLFYAGLLSLGMFLFAVKGKAQKKARLGMFTIVTVILIGLPIILPFFQLASRSTRSLMNVTELISGSLHPLHLFQLVIPNIFSHLHQGIMWGPDWSRIPENSIYVGFVLILSIVYFFKKNIDAVSRLEWTFLITGIVFLLLSLGKNIPGFEFLIAQVSIFQLFRNPSGMVIMWTFCMAVLAGVAFPYFLSNFKVTKKFLSILFFIGMAIYGLWLTMLYWFSSLWRNIDQISGSALSNNGFHTLARDERIAWLLLYQISILILITTLIVWINQSRLRFKKGLIVTLILFDLYMAVQPNSFFAPNHIYDSYRNSSQAEWLESNLEQGNRILSLSGYLPFTGLSAYFQDVFQQPPFMDSRYTWYEQKTYFELTQRRNNLAPNWNMPTGHLSPAGFSTLVLQKTADYWENTPESSAINEVDRVVLSDERLDQQGVKYFLLNNILYPEGDPEQVAGLPVAERNVLWTAFENENANKIVTGTDGVSIDEISLSTNSLTIQKSGESGMIDIMMAAYPGWNCFRSVQECQLIEKDDFGYQIESEAGVNEYTLRFKPTNWNFYVTISLISLTVYVFLVFKVIIWPAYQVKKTRN